MAFFLLLFWVNEIDVVGLEVYYQLPLSRLSHWYFPAMRFHQS